MSGRVVIEYRDSVAWLTLDRPDKLNAMAGNMRQQLQAGIAELAGEEGVQALVIAGAGGAFCAGGDVEHMANLRDNDDEAGFRALLHAGAEVVLALQAFPGPTLAAVEGVAVGAGLALALACDLRLASPDARFGASWGRIGLVPDWGASFWLPRLVGLGRAMELAISGRIVGADEALRIGLVHRIVDAGSLQAEAQATATELGRRRDVIARTKTLMRGGAESTLEHALAREAEAQEECFGSDELADGLRAFLERRRS